MRFRAADATIASDLVRTELRRAAAGAEGRAPARADRLVAQADLLCITAEVFDDAGRLGPSSLRSLDALHLAAARLLGPDLADVVAYDGRSPMPSAGARPEPQEPCPSAGVI